VDLPHCHRLLDRHCGLTVDYRNFTTPNDRHVMDIFVIFLIFFHIKFFSNLDFTSEYASNIFSIHIFSTHWVVNVGALGGGRSLLLSFMCNDLVSLYLHHFTAIYFKFIPKRLSFRQCFFLNIQMFLLLLCSCYYCVLVTAVFLLLLCSCYYCVLVTTVFLLLLCSCYCCVLVTTVFFISHNHN
jgi:hypothetical protein